MDCRQLEVRQAVSALEQERSVWVVCEHDMGGDDFLAVLRHNVGVPCKEVFKLDLSQFEGLQDLSSLQTIHAEGDINQLCELLLEAGPSYLILENLRTGHDVSSEQTLIEGIKTLVSSFIDYCPELLIIVRAPLLATAHGIQPVILKGLNEAECKTYIELHPDGCNATKEDIESGAIHGYTSGFPARIDRTLRLLRFTEFSQVALGSSGQSLDYKAQLPIGTTETIENLKSGDTLDQRSYDLLVALSIFRFGESADTIRYFRGNKRLKQDMADRLVELSLAEPAETFEIGLARGKQDKFIVVKPAIQQYIHNTIGEEELPSYYEEAAAIYFGKDWRLGNCKLNSLFRLSEHRIHSVMEQNATLILARLISDATDKPEPDEKQIINRIKVFRFFVARLDQDDKYLFITRLCSSLLPRVRDFDEHPLVMDIRYMYARSLRMMRKEEASIEEFEKILPLTQAVNRIASIYVNIAYCYKGLKKKDLAKEYALKAIATKIKGETAYLAKSIIILVSDEADRKSQALSRLATRARRENCSTAANNIQFELIGELTDPVQQLNEYKSLAEAAKKDNDPYNKMRAIIDYCDLAVDLGVELSQREFNELTQAYKYACSQRQTAMFNQGHAAMWGTLERQGEPDGLVQLFRHSSLLQRLTNQRDEEEKYLRKLTKYAQECGVDIVRRVSNAAAFRYFSERALSHKLLSPKQLKLKG